MVRRYSDFVWLREQLEKELWVSDSATGETTDGTIRSESSAVRRRYLESFASGRGASCTSKESGFYDLLLPAAGVDCSEEFQI